MAGGPGSEEQFPEAAGGGRNTKLRKVYALETRPQRVVHAGGGDGVLFDSEAPKPKKGLRKYWPLLAIVIIVGGVIAYFALHNLSEKRAVADFLTQLENGNYKEAYNLWQPAPGYSYDDFLHDWGPKGDYGKVREFKIVGAESKGNELVVVTVTINNQTPPLSLVVDRKTKGLAYSPF